jgi:hypothetical protein
MATCGANCGITKERERELRFAWATAERVHRGLVWTPLESIGPRVVSYDALKGLAAKLETLLPVRARVRLGDFRSCDALYLLAGLETIPLCDVADGIAPADATLARRETYVRVSVSPHGRFAALQEVVISVADDEGGTVILEEPQAGVIDRRLQGIVKGLQGALRKERLVVLDLAALLPPLEPPSAQLEEAFLETASLWSLLFEGPSPMTTRASWIARSNVTERQLDCTSSA